MKILNDYIQSTILQTTLVVFVAFLGVEIFFGFVGELRSVGTGYYSVWQAMQFVLLELPMDFYGLFPMTSLVGVLLGLSFLAGNNELTVMRASGVSIYQIVFSVLKFAGGMVIVMMLIGETAAPLLHKIADRNKSMALSGGQALNTHRGIWIKDKNNFIHIQSMVDDNHLTGVTRYQFDDQHQLINASYAKEAVYHDQHWWLSQVMQSTFKQNQVTSTETPQMMWDLTLPSELLKVGTQDPNHLTLRQLRKTIRYHHDNGLREATYALSFWKRLCQPFAAIVMMLLAIPFIFGPLRTATLGLRLVAGMGMGFTFYMLNQFFGPLSLVFQFSPLIGALLPTLLFAWLGYAMLQWRIIK